MPRIPSYRQQKLPSTNIGAAPISPGAADVAGGAIGQGLSSFGQGLGNFGESMFKIKQADDQNKDLIAEAKLKVFEQEAIDEYNIKSASDGDYNNHRKYAEEAVGKFKVNTQTLNWGTKRAQNRAAILSSGMADNFYKRVELDVIEKRAKEAVKTTTTQYINDLSSLDASPFQQEKTRLSEEATRQALSYFHGPELVEQMMTEIQVDGLEQKVIAFSNIGNFEEARKIAEDKILNPEQKRNMLNTVTNAELALKKQKKVDSDVFGKSILREILTTSDLEPMEKQKALDILKLKATDPNNPLSQGESRALLNEIEQAEKVDTAAEEHNVKAYADMLQKITTTPENVTEEEIWAGVKQNLKENGTGWTTSDAKEFLKIRDDETNPLKSISASIYFNQLKDDWINEVIETPEEYDIAMHKLTVFAKNNPKATEKEWSEAYNGIMDKQKKGMTWKIFREFFFPPSERVWDVLGVHKEMGKLKSVKVSLKMPQVKTKEELDLLPSGTEFLGPNGDIRRKK